MLQTVGSRLVPPRLDSPSRRLCVRPTTAAQARVCRLLSFIAKHEDFRKVVRGGGVPASEGTGAAGALADAVEARHKGNGEAERMAAQLRTSVQKTGVTRALEKMKGK